MNKEFQKIHSVGLHSFAFHTRPFASAFCLKHPQKGAENNAVFHSYTVLHQLNFHVGLTWASFFSAYLMRIIQTAWFSLPLTESFMERMTGTVTGFLGSALAGISKHWMSCNQQFSSVFVVRFLIQFHSTFDCSVLVVLSSTQFRHLVLPTSVLPTCAFLLLIPFVNVSQIVWFSQFRQSQWARTLICLPFSVESFVFLGFFCFPCFLFPVF